MRHMKSGVDESTSILMPWLSDDAARQVERSTFSHRPMRHVPLLVRRLAVFVSCSWLCIPFI